MNRFFFPCAAVFLATVAHADPLAGMYGKIVDMTAPDGTRSTLSLTTDMTWEISATNGTERGGTFQWADSRTICFAQTYPDAAEPSCMLTTQDRGGTIVGTLVGEDGKVWHLTTRR